MSCNKSNNFREPSVNYKYSIFRNKCFAIDVNQNNQLKTNFDIKRINPILAELNFVKLTKKCVNNSVDSSLANDCIEDLTNWVTCT